MERNRSAEIFERRESAVRSYSRFCPIEFDRAEGALLFDRDGTSYVDFLAGAGALNYGHNNPYIIERIAQYLRDGRILHGLDLFTTAKREFLEALEERVLGPASLDYRVQFCGPTGTNAVEASLKLARKATRRTGVVSFMGGFHGVTLGSLSVTSVRSFRDEIFPRVPGVTFLPFEKGFPESVDSIAYLEALLEDDHSGFDLPAAVIVETVQGEGGVYVASASWLRRLRDLCDRYEIVLVCDDIQVGCGRTGPFFSFERAGILPDVVTLSKSLSGIGLPLSLVLVRPDLDCWDPGEHSGTFRGNQLAFVGAKAALEYRDAEDLATQVHANASNLEKWLSEAISELPEAELRGVGMIWGIDLVKYPDLAERVVAAALGKGLLVERSGRSQSVIKLLPPLDTPREILARGCAILTDAVREAARELG